MGNIFSQETDSVIVKVKPYFFTTNEDGYSQDKIKNFKITKMISLIGRNNSLNKFFKKFADSGLQP